MEKLVSFILCVIAVVIGVAGGIVEINRVINNPMSDEQWIGEILFIIIYACMAIGGAVYAVKLWKQKY